MTKVFRPQQISRETSPRRLHQKVLILHLSGSLRHQPRNIGRSIGHLNHHDERTIQGYRRLFHVQLNLLARGGHHHACLPPLPVWRSVGQHRDYQHRQRMDRRGANVNGGPSLLIGPIGLNSFFGHVAP